MPALPAMAREAAAAPGAAPGAPPGAGPEEPPPQVRPLKAQILLSMKRSFDLFAGDEASVTPPVYEPARDLAIASRVRRGERAREEGREERRELRAGGGGGVGGGERGGGEGGAGDPRAAKRGCRCRLHRRRRWGRALRRVTVARRLSRPPFASRRPGAPELASSVASLLTAPPSLGPRSPFPPICRRAQITSEYSGLACYVPRGADPSRPRRDPAISTSDAAKAAARVGDSIFARLRGEVPVRATKEGERGEEEAPEAPERAAPMLTDGSERPAEAAAKGTAGREVSFGAGALAGAGSSRALAVAPGGQASASRAQPSSAASSAALQLALVSSRREAPGSELSSSVSSALALSSATLAGQALRETGALSGEARVRPAAGPKALTPAARAVLDALRTQEEADREVEMEEAEEGGAGGRGPAAAPSTALALPTAAPAPPPPSSAQIARSAAARWPRPSWHAPWRPYRVISGHLGWVRSVAFEPGNEWFATGSGDRTIKIWDTASGRLKLTLTGHIEQVTGLAVSDRSPYLFSCGLDKMVKCWDLETNRVIRSYHGHLSGVRCLALHPELDILFTGGRDATCRVWDVRTRSPIHVLTGHDDAVATVAARATDPQVVTGSHDKTVRLWDLRTGKTLSVLTHHKKSVRALVTPRETRTLVSASADGIKKFLLPAGEYLHPFIQDQRAIINCLATNADGVLASGGDDGSLWFWDRHSGNAFQKTRSIAQPGSLEGEAAIMAASFDVTGTRLVTCEADKTIKMWKEDENATEETHPIEFAPPSTFRRY